MSVGTVVRNIGIGARYTGQFFMNITSLNFITNLGATPYHLWSDESTLAQAGLDLSARLFVTGIVGALLGMEGAAIAALFLIPPVILLLGLALSVLGEWIEQQEEADDHRLSMI